MEAVHKELRADPLGGELRHIGFHQESRLITVPITTLPPRSTLRG